MTETVTDEKYEKAMRDFSRRVVHEVAPDVLADEYRKGYVDGQKAAVGAGLSAILAEVAAAATTECPYCHACWPECLHCDGTGRAVQAPSLREACAALLSLIRRDAPHLSGKVLGDAEAALATRPATVSAEPDWPGRTDDRLSDVIDRALTKGTSCR